MSYDMVQMDGDFYIAAENKSAALLALHALEEKWARECTQKYGRSVEPEKCLSLEDQLGAYSWNTETDELGNLTSMYFIGEHKGDEEQWLSAIAPYVSKGSSLEMIGEDNAMWMWYFDGKSVCSYRGRIVYPDCPDEILSGQS